MGLHGLLQGWLYLLFSILYICSFFKEAFSKSERIAFSGWVVVNDELEGK
jgi:hypothetical protein